MTWKLLGVYLINYIVALTFIHISFQNIETPLVDNENKTKSEEAKISSNKTFQEANEVHLHLKKGKLDYEGKAKLTK